jgi:hypothetical protein
MAWVEPLILVAGVGAGAVLVLQRARRIRLAAIAVAVAALTAAPATWAAQTIGHPTSGTFPAGGPSSATMDGGPGGGGFGGRGFGGRGFGGGFQPRPGFAPGGAAPGGGAGGGGGGMFGGEDLTSVLSYIKQHGGGTLAISSQTGAETAVRQGSDVAGIGGFSGRESQVSVSWLADAVSSGKIRWVLTSGGGRDGGGGPGGFGGDTRVGSQTVMTAVANTCKPANTTAGTLYDCSGSATALASAAG